MKPSLTEENCKIMITSEYRSFLKPANHPNPNKKFREVSVGFITENFEPKDVNQDRILAENEIYYLKESSPQFSEKLTNIKRVQAHKGIIGEVGRLQSECSFKNKLLTQLEASKNNFEQSSEEFRKKFENALKKDNHLFIANFFSKMKAIELSIGLEFPGSLAEMVLSKEETMIDYLETAEGPLTVEAPKGCNRGWVLSDGFIMLVKAQRNKEGFLFMEPVFYKCSLSANEESFSLQELTLERSIGSINHIIGVKYFSEANLLILSTVPPLGVKKCSVLIYEVTLEKETHIHLEPRHRIDTEAESVQFVRGNGVEHIIYSDDTVRQSKSNCSLTVLSLEETFGDPKSKPQVTSIPIQISIFKSFSVGNNLVVMEGHLDEIAVVDISLKEVLGYYKEHKKGDYFNYLGCAYSRSKNLVFMLHNTNNGAVISSFRLDPSTLLLVHQEDYHLYDDLKKLNIHSFASEFFIFQFNPKTNRLNICDDQFQALIYLKLNHQSRLQTDGSTLGLKKFGKKNSSPYGLFLRVEGVKFFMLYFVYEDCLEVFKLRDD